jgi:MFS superfamily sulfate permease-like transporter
VPHAHSDAHGNHRQAFSVDITAADAICELDDALRAADIELCFAEMKDPVKDKLKRFGLFKRLGERTFFPTVGEAVRTYRSRTKMIRLGRNESGEIC